MLIFGTISTLLLLYYALYLWRSAVIYGKYVEQNKLEKRSDKEKLPFISVIVPARNEAVGIAACLQDILGQEYPGGDFEVILVNDHSEDETVTIAENTGARWPNFQLIHLAEMQGLAYKKAAVAAGIAQAKGDVIVTTDADCRMGPGWLYSLAACFGPKTGLVSGPVGLESETLFGHFQALEFMGLSAVGAAAIWAGSPNMCNGANLAYRKAAFEAVGGFAGIDHIASGDDELLMHKIASETDWKITFAADTAAIVRTAALRTWPEFRAQRIRWVSKSRQYKRASITATLVIAWLGMACFPLLLIGMLFDPLAGYFLLGNLLLKIAAEFPILYRAATFFDKLHLLRYLVPEQVAHIGYVLWVGLAGNAKSYTWKGREVK